MDDAPFDKRQTAPVPVIGVAMEGAAIVESVACAAFPVDGEDATRWLGDWIAGLRCRPLLHGIVLGGITIAGLGIVDLPMLAERLALPILAVTRKNPVRSELRTALTAAGLSGRIPVVERSPRAYPVASGLFLAHAGGRRTEAERLLHGATGKGLMPEPLRIAHLVGQGMVLGESRGRV